MSNEEQGASHKDPGVSGDEKGTEQSSDRAVIRLEDVKTKARLKTAVRAEAEGMSIERYEEIEEAIKAGRFDEFSDDERAAVQRIQESFRAETLAHLQRVISNPWMKAFAANNVLQGAIGSQMSTVLRNVNTSLAAQNTFSALQSSLGVNLPHHLAAGATLSPEIMNAFRGITLPTETFLKSINPLAETMARITGAVQDVARASLVAGFATRTQEFLTTDRELRYNWNRPVWHYTNGYALLSIVKNGKLWASSPEHLNDSSEMVHGFEIIKGAFENSADGERLHPTSDQGELDWVEDTLSEVLDDRYFYSIINDVYYISASRERDSLTLWRNYADGDGFAIGIDTSVEISADGIAVDEGDDSEHIRGDIPLISGWYRVQYKPRDKARLAKNFIENAREDINSADEEDRPDLVRELRKQAVILASVMKHEAFQDEREVRWMTTNFTTYDPVHYEHGRRSIVPVLHVMAASNDEDLPLPLKGLWCSPISPISIVRTMQGLLEQQGYDEASRNIKKSVQPFKG